jgi:hypothetical protein
MTVPQQESGDAILRLLALYRRAHYGVLLPDRSGAVLQVGAPLPLVVADWIAGTGNAVYLTACNPHSRALSPEQNAERMRALREQLRVRGERFLEGAGVLLGEAWSEPSVLVASMPMPVVDRMARELEQNAVLTIARGGPPRLRLFRNDWRAHVDDSVNIDWAPPAA